MSSNGIDYTKFINTTFDNFYIEKIIGEGGMGVVYKAFDRTLDRHVALKVLKKECINKENNLIDRFKLEAINIAKLQHPNIINVFSVGYCNQLYYIVMEYVKGEKLSDLLFNKSLDLEKTLNIIYNVAKGLEYSHIHHVIHRDIKPSNIMINNNDEVKIVDFGLSKTMASSSDLSISRYGDIIGTPVYLAPELWESSSNVSNKSDIYSLGVVLYECVTGSTPYKGGSNNELYKSLLLNKFVEAKVLNQSIPDELNTLLNSMLNANPKLRPNISDIILEINNIKEKYDLKNVKIEKIDKNDTSHINTIILGKQNSKSTRTSISKEFENKYKETEKYLLFGLIAAIIFVVFSVIYLFVS